MFFFDRAFRSFFLGGSLFAVVAMLVWWLNYPQSSSSFSGVSPMLWHAHEMVFGYALATVTGFLLTAVMNWTRSDSASGVSLMGVFLLWLSARIGFLWGAPLEAIMALDMLFNLGLFVHFAWPVYRRKLWAQAGLAAKFLLLIFANGVFYAGALGWLDHAALCGVVLGLFLVLAINLTMMRRLIPFFTEKALGLAERPNSNLLDQLALVGFLALMVAATFFPTHWFTTVIAWPLAAVHLLRFKAWYHPKVWSVVLLWPLHFSYGFMIFGMVLYGFAGLDWLAPSLALHALAAGGIGLLCSSMMARISLGHTNRNVFDPPKAVFWVFGILAVAAIVRVVLPIVDMSHYVLWMHFSQLGWVVAFGLLTVLYVPILARPSPEKDTGIRL
ncbi:NnrS family protein [Hydrogenovibrio crunogenus]|uniref:NnrS family protein n=1 Tax=Hydrogenovibrio crunogenus TaxID=39765 RepID=A0A4P7P267_9GAMM|nr:NnrS family protein [Hydrogenovibrio crunogenus]QBZ84251.1 NnrS family protein [Hydrogenovibrio crunogenus]